MIACPIYIIKDYMLHYLNTYINALPINIQDLQNINNSLIIVSYELYSKHDVDVFGTNAIIVTSDIDSALQSNNSSISATQFIDGVIPNQPAHIYSINSEFMGKLDDIDLNEINPNNRTRTFFTLNGRNALHRTMLVNSLYDTGLITQGLVVYHNTMSGDGLSSVSANAINKLSPPHQEDPFKKNWGEPEMNITWHDGIANPNYYNHYNIEIIAETSINVHFITEKTIKALSSKIPFLILSRPGFLEYLRTFGFKTFGNIWDESYDRIADTQQRITKILEVLGELIHSGRVYNLTKECNDVLQHNAVHVRTLSNNHIRNKTNQISDAVDEILIDNASNY